MRKFWTETFKLSPVIVMGIGILLFYLLINWIVKDSAVQNWLDKDIASMTITDIIVVVVIARFLTK